jgi:hypothetical protein
MADFGGTESWRHGQFFFLLCVFEMARFYHEEVFLLKWSDRHSFIDNWSNNRIEATI